MSNAPAPLRGTITTFIDAVDAWVTAQAAADSEINPLTAVGPNPADPGHAAQWSHVKARNDALADRRNEITRTGNELVQLLTVLKEDELAVAVQAVADAAGEGERVHIDQTRRAVKARLKVLAAGLVPDAVGLTNYAHAHRTLTRIVAAIRSLSIAWRDLDAARRTGGQIVADELRRALATRYDDLHAVTGEPLLEALRLAEEPRPSALRVSILKHAQQARDGWSEEHGGWAPADALDHWCEELEEYGKKLSRLDADLPQQAHRGEGKRAPQTDTGKRAPTDPLQDDGQPRHRDATATSTAGTDKTATEHRKQDSKETPPDGPFDDLRDAGKRLKLKGKMAAVVRLLCERAGSVPLADLALECEWVTTADENSAVYVNSWNSLRHDLNQKLKTHSWRLVQRDMCAVAVRLKPSAGK